MCCTLATAASADPLPPSALAALRASGLPLSSFGVYFRPVDAAVPGQFAALNAEQPFRMASTAKVVTSLAALNLLGPAQRVRTTIPPVLGKDVRVIRNESLVVTVRPTRGARAAVDASPRVGGLTIVNDVLMGGGCGAYARWEGGGSATLLVSGRWDASCGTREVASLRVPLAPTTARAAARRSAPAVTALPALIRDINKTSNNDAARSLLASLAVGTKPDPLARVRGWLRSEGLADDDIQLELGSGQSPQERGKPRALVQLLCNAWHAGHGRVFVDSLPIAGIDGTLAQRLRHGVATGHAYLKTGTLSDTRALAGYVVARSGKVYALAALVNHPQAARATPALDRLVEALARDG